MNPIFGLPRTVARWSVGPWRAVVAARVSSVREIIERLPRVALERDVQGC